MVLWLNYVTPKKYMLQPNLQVPQNVTLSRNIVITDVIS